WAESKPVKLGKFLSDVEAMKGPRLDAAGARLPRRPQRARRRVRRQHPDPLARKSRRGAVEGVSDSESRFEVRPKSDGELRAISVPLERPDSAAKESRRPSRE